MPPAGSPPVPAASHTLPTLRLHPLRALVERTGHACYGWLLLVHSLASRAAGSAWRCRPQNAGAGQAVLNCSCYLMPLEGALRADDAWDVSTPLFSGAALPDASSSCSTAGAPPTLPAVTPATRAPKLTAPARPMPQAGPQQGVRGCAGAGHWGERHTAGGSRATQATWRYARAWALDWDARLCHQCATRGRG